MLREVPEQLEARRKYFQVINGWAGKDFFFNIKKKPQESPRIRHHSYYLSRKQHIIEEGELRFVEVKTLVLSSFLF